MTTLEFWVLFALTDVCILLCQQSIFDYFGIWNSPRLSPWLSASTSVLFGGLGVLGIVVLVKNI